MLRWLGEQGLRNIRVTVRALLDQFTRRPYGWTDPEALGILATLVQSGTVDLHRAQKPIDPGETGLAGRLLKKAGQEETVVRPSDTIDPKALATARKLAPEYLLDADKINTADAPKIAAAYRVQLERDRETLTRDQERAGRGYPFGTALTEAQTTVDALLTTSGTAALMAGILAQQDALEDWVDLRARVQGFYAGEQVRIFEEVRDDLKDLEPDLPRVNVPELQDRDQAGPCTAGHA